jgi:hypothetical protein
MKVGPYHGGKDLSAVETAGVVAAAVGAILLVEIVICSALGAKTC